MGASKTELFSKSEIKLAGFDKALSHPARIAIIKLLLKKQRCICGDIVDEIQLAQSTISQHLKELKDAGIIQGTIEGPAVCYCIDPKTWSAMSESIGKFFDVGQKSINNCC